MMRPHRPCRRVQSRWMLLVVALCFAASSLCSAAAFPLLSRNQETALSRVLSAGITRALPAAAKNVKEKNYRRDRLPYRPERGLLPLNGLKVAATGAYERQYWYWYERALPNGFFPPHAEALARSSTQAMRAQFQAFAGTRAGRSIRPLLTTTWTELGPIGIDETKNSGSTFNAGRIMAILLQKNQNRIIIGSASGGIWKRSLTAGSVWAPKSDFASHLSIGALAADPNNPDTIYAGTGEPGVNVDAFLGNGLLKSTDGGETWARIDQNVFTSKTISQLWVDPGNPLRILAAVLFDGLYESVNGGQTFPRRLAQGGGIGFAVSPADPQRILYSRTDPLGSTAGDLFISTNGGTTFTPVAGPWSGSGRVVGRIDLSWSPSDPTRVWASVGTPIVAGTAAPGVYRSTDGGQTWGTAPLFQFLNAAAGEGQGWYDNAIAVYPNNPDQVYVGGVNLYRGTAAGAVTEVAHWFTGTGVPSIHADQHAIAFDPTNPNTAYFANDGGMFITTNNGTSFTSFNDGLGTVQFYYGCVGDNNAFTNLYGGTQDNGSPGLFGDANLKWTDTFGGDGFQCAVDPGNTQVMYATGQFSRYGISTDGGRNFTTLPDFIMAGEAKPFFTPLGIDPSDGTRIYGGAQRLYRGISDRASTVTWSAISANILIPNQQIRNVAVAKTNGNVIYASGGATLMRTTTGADPFTNVSPLGGQFITDVAVHPANSDDVVLTRSGFAGGTVLRTTNGGQNWTDLTANLPPVPANGIAVRPNGSRLDAFVGTDTGLFYADLNSPQVAWAPLGAGLPNVACYDVLLANGGQTVVAVTHGRGMWFLDVPLESLVLSFPNGGEALPVGQQVKIAWTSAGFTAGHTVKIELSRDGGATFNPADVIAAAAPDVSGTNTFAWTPAQPVGTQYRLRITSNTRPEVTDTSTANFQLVVGALVVQEPNGGVTWRLGEVRQIVWRPSDFAATLPTAKIEISRDSGATWTTIIASTSNAQDMNGLASASWVVSGPVTTTAKVRVSAGAFIDTSDANFQILDPISITGITPSSGFKLVNGQVAEIKFTTGGFTGPVRIELSRDGGRTWETLLGSANTTPGQNTVNWTVSGKATKTAKLRISTLNESPNAQALGTGLFEVMVPALKVITPKNGQTLLLGVPFTVTWSQSGFSAGSTVRVELSRNGGLTWQTVIASTPNNGSAVFTPAGAVSGNARIRITSIPVSGEPSVSAVSGTVFIQRPTLFVVHPTLGETWELGNQAVIEWSGTTAGQGTVDIFLSRDGGVTFVQIFNDTPNDGGQSYGVNGVTTSQGRVRIVWNTLGTVSAQSGTFAIGRGTTTSGGSK